MYPFIIKVSQEAQLMFISTYSTFHQNIRIRMDGIHHPDLHNMNVVQKAGKKKQVTHCNHKICRIYINYPLNDCKPGIVCCLKPEPGEAYPNRVNFNEFTII